MKLFFKNIYNNKFFRNFAILCFCALVLIFSVRGIPGNPSEEELNTTKWRNGGPFEQTARFALLYSIVENNTVHFTLPLARFASPDLVMHENKFISLFPPGISIIGIPGYIAGRYFGLAQVGTFSVIAFFALCNIFLIRAIAIKIGVNPTASMLGGIIFAFATPAFPYAVDFYQHHISTFFILISIYSLLYFPVIFALIITFFCYGFSVVVDYPNFLMMMPLAIYSIMRFIEQKITDGSLIIKVKIWRIFTGFAVVFPLVFLLWFNQISNGSPFVISAALPRVSSIDENGKAIYPVETKEYKESALNVASKNQIMIFDSFYPRLMLNGLYTHFVSPDRGMLLYTPIMFFGFIGAVTALRKKVKMALLLSYIASINILIYSMWGDPWGGWAFGSRYLIPSYAILAIFTAYLIKQLVRKNILALVFYIVLAYSVAINTLGALTSNLNPPQIEAEALSRDLGRDIKFTYERNFEFINYGSKSFIFEVFGKYYISSWNYYLYITILIISVCGILLIQNKYMEKVRYL